MRSNHDIHSHNLFSQCCHDKMASVPAMIEAEEKLGVEIFGLSNHVWDENVPGASKWYSHQSVAHAMEAKYAYDSYKGKMRLLFGVETEYAAMSDTLGMSYENAMKFDYLLVPHSHNHMKNFVMPDFPEITKARENFAMELCLKFPEMTASGAKSIADSAPQSALEAFMPNEFTDRIGYVNTHMINSFRALFENKEFNRIIKARPVSIAHPFAPCAISMNERKKAMNALLRDYEDELLDCFSTAAGLGVAMEINCSAIEGAEGTDFDEHHTSVRLFRLAKKAGCRFTFGTDSHGLGSLSKIANAEGFTAACGITEADVADWDILKL